MFFTETPNLLHVGVVAHFVGAAAFLILTLLMCAAQRGKFTARGVLLVFAAAATCGSSMVAGVFALRMSPPYETGFWLLEALNPLVWSGCLAYLIRPSLHGSEGEQRERGRALVPVFLGAVGFVTVCALIAGDDMASDLQWFGLLALSMTAVALAILFYRETRPEQRWAVKFLCVGVGGIFAYDLCVYAFALVAGFFPEALWNARGLVLALLAPVVGLGIARHPNWSVELFVSRTVVVHSSVMFAAGIYLGGVAALALYVRRWGGQWGGVVQITLIFLGILSFALLTLSDSVRARVRVLINKHFFPFRYDYREEWLSFTQTLSSGPERDLRTRAIRALARFLDAPGGLLWTRGEAGTFLPAGHWQMSVRAAYSVIAESSLARFLQKRQWVIDLEQYRADPKLYPGLEIPEWLNALKSAWVIVPLIHLDDLLGFIILKRPKAYRSLDWEDHDLLKTAGRQLSSYLALLDTTEALASARQFDTCNRLTAYVIHDLKNILAQLSMLVANVRRFGSNKAFMDDAVHSIENARSKVDLLVKDLKEGNWSTHARTRDVAVEQMLQDVVLRRSAYDPVPRLLVFDEGLIVHVDPVRFAMIITHLISNAQEATGNDGSVTVSARRDYDFVLVEITDTGVGMNPTFLRDRLFQPFETTKGEGGMGVGVYESRQYVEAMKGTVEVTSIPGEGTTFGIRLPLVVQHGQGSDLNEIAGAAS